MPETLRNQIPDPTHYQDKVDRIQASGQSLQPAETHLDNMLTKEPQRNNVTLISEGHAYEVAHAIKPPFI